MYNAAVSNAVLLAYTKTVVTTGIYYRFKVASANPLGIGEYSSEIQLMAADAPLAPTLDTNEDLRTLTSIGLTFTPNVDDGGSSIIGYELWRDEGIAGSPYSMLYNGTGKPE